MESSGGSYHHPGAQDEPFFDLLQQGAPISAPKTGHANNSAYNAPKKMENSSDFNFAGGDDVLPNFDFQPIRTSAASSSSNASGASSTAARIEEGGGRQGSPPASYTSYEPMVRRSREPPPTYETPVSRAQEHEKESFDSATAAAVERTVKKYADNLLRVLEGLTGRLSQLESSTQRLEHLFEEIKIMVGETHGEADGKLRSLESHILEVHRGVQVLRDRQEIFEAQSQLAKLQLAKGESAVLHSEPSAPPPPPPPPPPGSNAPSQLSRASSGKALLEAPPQHQAADTPSSSYYQPQPQLQLQQMPSLPAPPPQQPRPPPPPLPQQQQQAAPPQQQHSLQLQQPQQQQHQVLPQQQLQQQAMQLQQPNEVSHHSLHQQPPPPQPQPPQRLSHPPQHQPQPPHAPHAPHPPPPYPQQQQQQQQQQPPYPQQQQQQSSQPPPMPNYGHPSELPPYPQHPQGPHPPHPHHVPHQPPPSSYPSDLPGYHPSYGHPRPGMPPPQQQPPPSPQPQQPHNAGMYEPSMGRAGSGQLSLPAPPYVPQGHPGYEPQGMNPGSGYPGSAYRVAQPVPSAPSGSGGSGGYPRLPVAQPLPHALPTSGSGSGPPSSGNPSVSANRVPIDEVIDKVTAMGFSKGQVRDVVRRLTENGQSVDLNIVLDKLMNGETPAQAPPKGWFGR